MLFSLQKSMMAAWSVSLTLTTCTPSSTAMPALPGVQKSSAHEGLWRRRQHRACSRPPPPTTRTLIGFAAAATTGRPAAAA